VTGILSGLEDGVVNWADLLALAEVNSYYYDDVAGFSDARFISITETAKNSKVWALKFSVEANNPDGTSDVAIYTINLNGNNANLSGKFVFATDHDLAGFTLTYDIRGNGSNIAAFSIQ